MATEEDLIRQLVKESLERQILYETLSFSYPVSTVIQYVIKSGFPYVNYVNNTINIKFTLDKNNKERYDKLNYKLDGFYGWFHGALIANGRPVKDKLKFLEEDEGSLSLQYEPKFDLALSKLPPKIYHLTLFRKVDKIKKLGLSPRSSDKYFNFEDRIYFSINIDSLIELAIKKFRILSSREFAILEIDTNNLSDGMMFFRDHNFIGGMYTKENIDRFSIKPVLKFVLDEKGIVVLKEKIV